jgi:hypothetical protein
MEDGKQQDEGGSMAGRRTSSKCEKLTFQELLSSKLLLSSSSYRKDACAHPLSLILNSPALELDKETNKEQGGSTPVPKKQVK